MMKEGKAKKWKSTEASKSKKLVPSDHVAYMGELVIGRNSGTLEAIGGPCPIIAVYRPDVHLGALLHVCGGDAEHDGDNHEVLINRLVDMEQEISEKAACHVILDEVPAPGFNDEQTEKEQKATRKKYAARIKKYLREQGFRNVTIVYDGQGKVVNLNTEQGTLRVIDDHDKTAFSMAY